MVEHLEFINTHPNFAGFLMGLVTSLEENREDRSTIQGIKLALFGPLAGIGDAMFWFTLLPIVVGLAASFAISGSILGPLLFFGVYLAVWLLRIPLTHLGYRLGVKGLANIREHTSRISIAATILGVTVVGGLMASYVHIEVLTDTSH